MPELEVAHRIYSNGVLDDDSPTGARFVNTGERDASGVLPKEALAELDELLEKISPLHDDRFSWAVCRFKSSRQSFACIVVSIRGVADAAERTGYINHARIVAVDPKQSWFDAAQLVEAAQSFPYRDFREASPERRLPKYLELIADETTLVVHETAVATLQLLPRSFVCDFLIACLHCHGKREGTAMRAPSSEGELLIADMASAWAALPIAMQMRSSWALDAPAGIPVDVIFSTSEGEKPTAIASKAVVTFVAEYVNLLLDSPVNLSSMLSNPQIEKPQQLQEAVQRAKVSAPLLSIPELPSGNEVDDDEGAVCEVEMPKKRDRNETTTSRQRDWVPIDTGTTAELERQYRAMNDSIQAYVDRRFKTFEEQQAAALSAIEARQRQMPAEVRTEVIPASPGESPQFPVRSPASVDVDRGQRKRRRWATRHWVFTALAIFIGIILALIFWPPDKSRNRNVAGNDENRPTVVIPANLSSSGTSITSSQEPAAAQTITTFIDLGPKIGWAESFKKLTIENSGLLLPILRDAIQGKDLMAAIPRSSRDVLTAFESGVNDDPKERERLRLLLIDYLAARSDALDKKPHDVDGDLSDVTTALVDRMKQNVFVTSDSNNKLDMNLQSEILLRAIEKWP